MKNLETFLVLIILSLSPIKLAEADEIITNPISIESFDKNTIEGKIRIVLKNENIDDYVTELIVAQSKHESGNYTNSLTQYNNLFGRHYSKKDTFAISAGAKAEGHSRFAKYPSVEYATLSQLDYLKRMGYSFNWKTPYQYAFELKQKRYYEAPIKEYSNALQKFLNEDDIKNNF